MVVAVPISQPVRIMARIALRRSLHARPSAGARFVAAVAGLSFAATAIASTAGAAEAKTPFFANDNQRLYRY